MHSRRFVRLIWFFISVAVGIGLGLLAAWWLMPLDYANTSPASLRTDYRVDYILMVAEIYQHDGNLITAVQRLELLGADDVLRLVQQAAVDAQTSGYSTPDLQRLVGLSQALSVAATSTGGQP